eukprot:SAG31_NODE_36744_length_310_cov_1.687204_1_plen_92_part_01
MIHAVTSMSEQLCQTCAVSSQSTHIRQSQTTIRTIRIQGAIPSLGSYFYVGLVVPQRVRQVAGTPDAPHLQFSTYLPGFVSAGIRSVSTISR